MTFKYDVIGGRAPGAFPGILTRIQNPHEVTTATVDAANPPTRYGDPVVNVPGTGVRPVISTDTSIYGFLVKPYPVTDPTWPPQGFTFPEVPPTTENLNVMRQGYISVYVCNAAAKPPIQGQPVYVQVVAYGSGATAIPVGAISAFAEGTSGADAFAITGATWATNGVDANGFGEVRFYN